MVLLFAFVLSGCFEGKEESGDFLVRINDFKISADAIDSKIKFETELDSNFYLSDDTRTEFVKDLIQTQLIIQEAKRQKLDEQEKFRRTIQLYWESTLIRDLIAQKTVQLRKSTVISLEEVAIFFQKNKEEYNQADFEEVKDEIRLLLENERISERMEEWIEGLRKGAIIEIKDPELSDKVMQSGA